MWYNTDVAAKTAKLKTIKYVQYASKRDISPTARIPTPYA